MKTDRTNLDSSHGGGPNGSPNRDDAEWSALRYVLGEMTADEADAFERTLASDLQACERVAAAAGLATTLYTALATELETEISIRPASRRPASAAPSGAPDRAVRAGLWAIVGLVAAVCVLVAGGLSLLPVIGDHQDQAALDRTDTGASSLVAIWTERSTESAPDAAASELGGTDRISSDGALALVDPDDAAGDLADDSVLIADDDYDVPGWLIAAVGGKWNADGSGPEIREN
jgi:hypothetical protein